MNEILFYGGMVMSAALLLLTIVLFFVFHIPSTIKYFTKISKGKKYNHKLSLKRSISEAKDYEQPPEELEKTEIIDVAQNFGKALVKANTTQVLLEEEAEESKKKIS